MSHSELEKSCQSGLLSNKYALQVRVAGKTNYTWFVCQFSVTHTHTHTCLIQHHLADRIDGTIEVYYNTIMLPLLGEH